MMSTTEETGADMNMLSRKPNGTDPPNVVARRFGGRAPRTHICSDLSYVRVGGGRS